MPSLQRVVWFGGGGGENLAEIQADGGGSVTTSTSKVWIYAGEFAIYMGTGSSSPPSLPSGWHSGSGIHSTIHKARVGWDANTGTSNYQRALWRSGVFAGCAAVWSGVDLDDPFGGLGNTSSTGGTILGLQAVTLERTDGSSRVVSIVCGNDAARSLSAPSGFTTHASDSHTSGGKPVIGYKDPTPGQTSMSATQYGLPSAAPGGGGFLVELRAATL